MSLNQLGTKNFCMYRQSEELAQKIAKELRRRNWKCKNNTF